MTKLALLFAACSLTACIVGEDPKPMTYEEFVAKHVIETRDEAGGVHLSYDWDQPLESWAEVEELYAAYRLATSTGEQVSESIVSSRNGVDAIWSAADRTNISYCVADSFGAYKAAVVQAMGSASGAWGTASGGRVRYVYNPAQDANCTNANTAVTFNVVPIQQNSGLFASAFFPNYPRANRQVLINLTTSFAPNAPFPLVGILRHELGHTLGLRHETIRQDTADDFGKQCLENLFYRDITKFFDDESVMITPACLGIANVKALNPNLDISFFDTTGIKKIYR